VQDKAKLFQYSWAKLGGIYVFLCSGKIEYVGRKLDSGLGRRIYNQAKTGGTLKWDEMLKDKKTRIAAIPLSGDDSIWIASLEVYLIEQFKPIWNKRR
jgi:hypothetical protein